MGDPEAFAREAEQIAAKLATLPDELRAEFETRAQHEIADPLASRIGASMSGPWGGVLAGTVRTRISGGHPVIAAGGSAPLVSGGATGSELIFGSQFGSGNAVTSVASTSGHRAYRRHATRQFARNSRSTVFPTFEASRPWALEQLGKLCDDALERV